MTLFAENYQSILFNTARIFSSVFPVVLAYILANNFFTYRFAKKRFDFVPFTALAGVLILLQEQGLLTGARRYAAALGGLILLVCLLYTDPLKRKLLGGMVFAVMAAVSEIGASFVFSMLAHRLELFAAAAGESYMLLAKSGLANLLLILEAALVSALSKHYRRADTSLLLWIALLGVPAVTLLTFSVYQFYIENYPEDNRILSYIYLSCLGMVLINVLVFVLFARLQKQMDLKREKEMLASQLSLQTASIGRLETLYNRTRNFRHDIKNHILVMTALAEQEKYDELKTYLRDLSGVVDESDYVRISGISAVDAILNEKMYEAQALDVTTHFDVVNLDKNDVSPIDLCIILSNALDNAIEANRRIEDKTARWLRVKAHGNAAFCVISVANPVAEQPKTRPDGSFITDKKDADAHGYGLKSIESTARKYRGEMLAKAEDGAFTLVVRLNCG